MDAKIYRASHLLLLLADLSQFFTLHSNSNWLVALKMMYSTVQYSTQHWISKETRLTWQIHHQRPTGRGALSALQTYSRQGRAFAEGIFNAAVVVRIRIAISH